LPERTDPASDEEPLAREVAYAGTEYRDGEVLKIIDEEGLTLFSFDGIRRRSGLHQETLSRVLDRLEDRGLVAKGPQGYSVLRTPGQDLQRTFSGTAASVPLLQTLLPDDMDLPSLVAGLRGRWFGRLRWMGLGEGDDGTSLKWISEDGGIQVDADFTPGELNVTAHIREGAKLSEAIHASYELVSHLTRVYGRLRPRRRLSLMQLSLRHATAA